MKNETSDPPEINFSIELLSPCGLYCGICPQYTATPQKCGGCFSNKGYSKIERHLCGIQKCARNQKMERCNQCSQLHDCARLNTFSTWDSFIAHSPVINNLDKLNELGEDGFLESLRNAVVIKEYPPVPKSGSMTLGKLWGLIKPPYHPPQK